MESSEIRALIGRLLDGRHRELGFSPELETQFEQDRGPARAARLWHEGLISLIAFNFFYVGEWLTTRKVTRLDLAVQFAVITPLCLLVNTIMRLKPSRRVREGSVGAMAVVIALTYLALQAGKGAIEVAFTLVGVIVTAMFAAVILRLRFPYAVAACVAIVLGGYGFLLQSPVLRMDEKMLGAAMMTIAVGIALLSNYSLEREERLGYLLYLESEAQRREVADKNAMLATLSSMDKLTGLPNRRAYEERFEEIWAEAMAEGSSVSVIVVDVDHFKALNDVHGHLYGDEVLSRVGALLPQALRSTADFVARYGGEEFVVILPRTDRADAERVAERTRALIEMAGSPQQVPQPRSECLMWVTASCGASTCSPREGMDREMLLEMADQAMYQAKAKGRNRVVFLEFDAGAAGCRGSEAPRGERRIPVTGHVA